MVNVGRNQPPTVRLRRLAAEIRRLREVANLTREQVGSKIFIDPATLYRMETAKTRPQTRTILALLDLYKVSGEAREALLTLVREARQHGWRQEFGGLPDEYAAYINFESEARTVLNYESHFIPGLLQTEDYIHASITGVVPRLTTDEVQQRVKARTQRQHLIRKQNPLTFWAIVDEAALHRDVGGPAVMSAQLRHLAEVAREAHITVQILPYRVGAHPGMHGAFAILTFLDVNDPALVYVESMTADVFLERENEVRRYQDVFEILRATAMPPNDSIMFIESLAVS